jgi:hypothetical protein
MCSMQNMVGQKKVSQIWHMHIGVCWLPVLRMAEDAGHSRPLQQHSLLMAQSGSTLRVMP